MTSNIVGQDLSDYRWNNRLIIIYEDTNIETNAQLQQRTFLFHKNQLKERKLVLFHFDGQTLNRIFPKPEVVEIKDIGVGFLHPYETVLIGLDGGIKKRWTSVMQPQKIFDLIDSMPMRIQEMRLKEATKN